MSWSDHIIYPKSFFGCTSLKNGTLILAVIELILSIISALFYRNGYLSIAIDVLTVIFTILCIIGVKKDYAPYVNAYGIYLMLIFIFAVIDIVMIFLTLNPILFGFGLLYFLFTLYAFRVVRVYHKQMLESYKNKTTTTDESTKADKTTSGNTPEETASKV